MTFHRILFVLLFLFAPLTASAQGPYTFTLRHNQLGTFNNFNWIVSGSRAVRLTYLNLNYAPHLGQPFDYLLKGQVRLEDTGLWNIHAWRISPGRYKVWFQRKGSRTFNQIWTMPRMRLSPGGNILTVSHLRLTKQFPLGRIDGTVRFNASNTNSTLHRATLQAKR
jgi:hypothetical protein